jgi:spermidine synthase
MAKPTRTASSTPPEASGAPVSIKKLQWLLGAICFLSGASIMIIEIAANRLLSPLFGNSVYTWTSLIGVILISFSVGGYLGGWLTDKRADFSLLGWLLAGAAVMTCFIPAVHAVVAPMCADSGLIAGPLTVSVLVFAIPGILLGAISPASVRLFSSLQQDAHVGFAAGTISMLGSLGSFVGTFLTGFFLLGAFGVKAIFLGSAVVLLLLAGLAFLASRQPVIGQLPVWISALIAGGLGGTADIHAKADLGMKTLFAQDSFYHRVQVQETGEGSFARRYLMLDSTHEGGMTSQTGEIIMDYQAYWQIPTLKEGFQMQRALFLGAGAFGMPEALSKHWPQAEVDVVEIDPLVIQAGRDFFKLNEHPRVHAHADDARRFLRQVGDKRYDMIFGDAYNGVQAIPVHLASQEFFQLVKDRLTPHGIFVMNAITAVEGPKSGLLASMLTTLRAVFPHVEAFAVGGLPREPQNVILVATQSDWQAQLTPYQHERGTLAHRLTRSYVPDLRLPQSGTLITDDYNPVDAIIARGLRAE